MMQRRDFRENVNLAVRFRSAGTTDLHSGRLVNVSERGMLLMGCAPLAPETAIEVYFPTNWRPTAVDLSLESAVHPETGGPCSRTTMHVVRVSPRTSSDRPAGDPSLFCYGCLSV